MTTNDCPAPYSNRSGRRGTLIAICALLAQFGVVTSWSAMTRADPVTVSSPRVDWIAVNTGGEATVADISCSSAGNCTAIVNYVSYGDVSGRVHMQHVVTLTNGVWQAPFTLVVPGATKVTLQSISCVSPGNCMAGGFYRDGSGVVQALEMTQSNGQWQPFASHADWIAVNTGDPSGGRAPGSFINSVSCVSIGNCVVAGSYSDSAGAQAFVATQSNGTWVPYSTRASWTAANIDDDSAVLSVSCASAGNCMVGGYYSDADGDTDADGYQAFAVAQVNGVWQTEATHSDWKAVNTGTTGGGELPSSIIESVSCGAPGDCVVVGNYVSATGQKHFAAVFANGSWVPYSPSADWGAASHPSASNARLYSVSCSSAGNCMVGGSYTPSSNVNRTEAFVATLTNGAWDTFSPRSDWAALNTGAYASIAKVDCVSDGNCTVAGVYSHPGDPITLPDGTPVRYPNGDPMLSDPIEKTFLTSRINSSWQSFSPITAWDSLAAEGQSLQIKSLSCWSVGECIAGGLYKAQDSNGDNVSQAFVGDTREMSKAVVSSTTTVESAEVEETTTTTTVPTTSAKTVSYVTVAKFAKLAIPAGSRVVMKVSSKTSKICKVSGKTIKKLKPGKCTVTVTVTPKKGKAKSSKTTITMK